MRPPHEKAPVRQDRGELSEHRNDTPTISESPDISSIFARIIGDLHLCLVFVADDGQKVVRPVAVEEDPVALLAGHVAGYMPPTKIRTASGEEWVERRGRALAVRPVDGDGRCPFIAWDFDAATGGHACATSVTEAQAAARCCYEVMVAAGLPAILAASGGGDGRHVLSILPAAVPVAFAVYVVALVSALVKSKYPTAHIDLRPQTVNGHGAPIILPGGGWARAPGGGRVLFVHRPERAAALAALDGLLVSWDEKRAKDEADRLQRERQRAARVQRGGRAGSVESKDVNLAAVADVAGEFVRTLGAEIHVRCPACPGTVKINSPKRSWSCFQCGVGGVGDAAAYLLAKWLRPDADSAGVFDVLRAASQEVSHV